MQFAVCNELFGDLGFARSCQVIKAAGFNGVELAPHTIFGDFSGEMKSRIPEIRRVLDGEGLAFAGLHWLLVGPADLHVTSPDDTIWSNSWGHVARLIDLAGELGGGAMVFGSPSQRASKGQLTHPDAVERFTDGLMSVADRAQQANSRILLEALGSSHTDIVNTLEEVSEIVTRLAHPAIESVFDFHNVEDEELSWAELITEYSDLYTHVHLNELDGGPPTPDTAYIDDFRAAFAALRDTGYDRWVSLEIFTFPEDPAAVLRSVREFLEVVAG